MDDDDFQAFTSNVLMRASTSATWNAHLVGTIEEVGFGELRAPDLADPHLFTTLVFISTA